MDLDVVQADLGTKDITSIELGRIIDYLMIPHTLKWLNLWGNNIDDLGVKYLCDALRVNTSLSYINLGSNNIGDEGAKCLNVCLSCNSTLVSLDLSDNVMGDVGVKCLSKLLVTNTTLLQFHIHGNDVSDDVKKCLVDALDINPAITFKFTSLCRTDIPNQMIQDRISSNEGDYMRYMFPTSFIIHEYMKEYTSIACMSLSINRLKQVINNADTSKLTRLVVDGTHLEDGVIPSFIASLHRLKTLRIV